MAWGKDSNFAVARKYKTRATAANYIYENGIDVVLASAQAGAISVTLIPSISDLDNKEIVIKKTDTTSNIVRVFPASGDTIDDMPYVDLTVHNQSLVIRGDYKKWVIKSFTINSTQTEERVEILEEKYVRSTRFKIVSEISGIIEAPPFSTIVLDDFGGSVDAVVSEVDEGKPTFGPIYTSAGVMVGVGFDSNGNYLLTGLPEKFPIAIIYRVKQKLKDYDEGEDLCGTSELEYKVENKFSRLVFKKTANEAISALGFVSLDSPETCVKVDPNDAESVSAGIGIALNSAPKGGQVSIVVAGIIEDPFLNFPVNSRLFMSNTGTITNIVPSFPSNKFSVKIGTSLGNGSIYIKLERPLEL